ncbi:MAG: hypothetical protein IPN22_15285 [Bacteroidetes bacterium]|nr:hypothetical protein [Bacteroidota bacterium]
MKKVSVLFIALLSVSMLNAQIKAAKPAPKKAPNTTTTMATTIAATPPTLKRLLLR